MAAQDLIFAALGATPLVSLKSFFSTLWRDERGEAGVDEGVDQGIDEGVDASQEGAEGVEGDGQETSSEPEPFLRVNERVVYKTPEEAQRGFDNAGKRIAAYSQYGSPEEIGAKLQMYERMHQAFGPSPEQQPGETNKEWKQRLSTMPEEARQAWERFDEHAPDYMKSKGFVTKEELEQLLDERIEQGALGAMTRHQKVSSAQEHFMGIAKERGIPLTSLGQSLIEEILVRANQDENSELLDLWQAGKTEDFARLAFTQVFGESSKSASSSADNGNRQRGTDGKFVSAAEYDATKQKTKALPKAPPKKSAAPTEGVDDDLEDRINPKKRLAGTKEFAKRLFGDRLPE